MAETEQVTFLALSQNFPSNDFLETGSTSVLEYYRKVVHRDCDKLIAMLYLLDHAIAKRTGSFNEPVNTSEVNV